MADSLKPYLSSEKIAQLNQELGEKITRDYRAILKPDEALLVIVTLKGAMIFASDLVRHIDVPLEIDFVRLASYGAGTQSSGTVRFVKDIETEVANKHLLVLDEIVDSGRTLDFLIARLNSQNAASIKIGALLSKPSRREFEVPVDYVGMEVEDEFLVGYGLDFNEKYRQLKDICVLSQA